MAPGSSRSAWQQAAAYAFLGTTVFGCVAFGLALGYVADRWLGTQPWLLLVGLAFGIAAAAREFYRVVRKLSQMDDTDDNR